VGLTGGLKNISLAEDESHIVLKMHKRQFVLGRGLQPPGAGGSLGFAISFPTFRGFFPKGHAHAA